MRKSLAHVLMLVLVVLGLAAVPAPATSSWADEYSGPYYGADNFPPGCIRDMSATPDNICHHMRTDLNALDSPQVDVLIMVPVSPTAERDMRIMRQSIEMWEGGIDYLSTEMGLDWVSENVDFHVTVDYFDPTGEDGGEFTTYPIVDPEIVVIATNPVGGVGIGVDPVDFQSQIFNFIDENGVPCHGVQNPFDFEYWENLPGFESHHEARTGTFVEDCGGAGGNICFAINGAIDPEPTTIDFFNLFDLVSHEVGHCLTLGHVGDGAEGSWAVTPTNDIMAYNTDPPGLNKCVSTLDVEAFAIRMSSYIDTNGDGVVDDADRLYANDQIGNAGNPFQVQHPDDHFYASGTGDPMDCPQPDLGPVPGERTDWTPTTVATSQAVLQVTNPADGMLSDDGVVHVTGTVEHVALDQEPEPTETSGSHVDADSAPETGETIGLAGARVVDVSTATSPIGARLDTVTFESESGNTFYTEQSTFGATSLFGLDSSDVFALNIARTSDVEFTLTWTDAVGGTDLDLFVTGAADSEDQGASVDPVETFVLEDVTGNLDIRVEPYFASDPIEGTTYTLTATVTPVDTGPDGDGDGVGDVDDQCPTEPGTAPTGCPDSDGDGVPDRDDVCPNLAGNGADGCPIGATEQVHVYVDGELAGSQDVDTTNGADAFAITVELAEGAHDLLITWEDDGKVRASETRSVTHNTDDDGDGVPNDQDVCPGHDDTADADGDGVPDGCDVEVDGDRDGDGIGDGTDNCVNHPNADQSDIDGDGKGDVCDSDMDGDGHSNAKEEAHGTDPTDPNDYPGKPKPKLG